MGLFKIISGLIDTGYAIYQDQRNWNNMAPSKKKEAKYLDSLEDENAEDAFRRSQLFQEQYLTPQAQLQSLAAGYESIGLNKMGLAGFSAGASSASAPQASVSSPSGNDSVSPSTSNLMQALGLGLKEKELSIQRTRARTEQVIAYADSRLKLAQAAGVEVDNQYRQQLNELEIANRTINNNVAAGNLRKVLADADVAEVYATFAPGLFDSQVKERLSHADQLAASAALSRAQVNLTNAEVREVESKIRVNNKLVEQMNATIMKIEEECIVLGSQAAVNEQQIAESQSRVAKYQAQVRQIGAQIGLTEKEVQWYEWNHARQYNSSEKNPLFGVSRTTYENPGGSVSTGGTPLM